MQENGHPANLPFERAVLGAAILDPETLSKVTNQTQGNDYYSTANLAVFHTLCDHAEAGKPADVGIVARALQRGESAFPSDEEPFDYVAALITEAAAPSAVDQRITDLRACADARAVVDLAQSLRLRALESHGDHSAVASLLSDAEENLYGLTDRVVSQPWQPLDQVVAEAQTTESARVVMPTGFLDLDSLLQGGLRSGQLVCVAARPAQGKSTLAMDVARNAAVQRGVPGLFISLEMSRQELGTRYLASQAGVSLAHIKENKVSTADREKLDRASDSATDAPLYILDTVEPTLPAIRGAIIAAQRRLGIQWVVVDYLGLIETDGDARTRTESRQEGVARSSRALKALARQLDITILMVCQLNRGPEQRADKTPMLSDLRDSGQLEQDSDIIMLIYQEQTYDATSPRAGEADIIVAKHRNGPTSTITVAFQGHLARFVDMATADEPPPWPTP